MSDIVAQAVLFGLFRENVRRKRCLCGMWMHTYRLYSVVDDKDKFATITFGVDQGLLHRPEWATPSEKFRVIDLSEAQPHLD